MEKAIRKAVEVGWVDEWVCFGFPKYVYYGAIVRDPLFWQALGKAEGWGYDEKNRWDNRTWASHWHRFIDNLIEGKSPEDFFNNLIK